MGISLNVFQRRPEFHLSFPPPASTGKQLLYLYRLCPVSYVNRLPLEETGQSAAYRGLQGMNQQYVMPYSNVLRPVPLIFSVKRKLNRWAGMCSSLFIV